MQLDCAAQSAQTSSIAQLQVLVNLQISIYISNWGLLDKAVLQ